MKKSFLITALVLLLAAGLVYTNSRTPTLDQNQTIKLLNGKQTNWKQLQGKPTVVVFWATSCTTCMLELPKIAELKKNNPSLQVLAVAMSYDEKDKIHQYLEKNPFPFLLAHDENGSIQRSFPDIQFTPTTVLISATGVIQQTVLGDSTEAIQKLIIEKF